MDAKLNMSQRMSRYKYYFIVYHRLKESGDIVANAILNVHGYSVSDSMEP